ncbi:MAG: cupin domain-containing protein [Bacteroidota bacterium]
MKRNEFIKSTALGISALSLTSLITACKAEAKDAPSKENHEMSLQELQDPKIVKSEEGTILQVMGDNQTVKISGKDTNGKFTLIEQNNSPGMGIPPHIHYDEDEIFHVLEGQMAMTIGDKSTILGPGDLIFCPRGIPHSFKAIGDEKARVLLSIFPSGLEDMFEELSQLPAGPPDMEKIVQISAKYNIKFV